MDAGIPDRWISLSSHYRRLPFKPHAAVLSRSDGRCGTWYLYSVEGIRSLLEYRSLRDAIEAAEAALAARGTKPPRPSAAGRRRRTARRPCSHTLDLFA